MTQRRWDYAVLGAGAMGSVIAAHLSRAGHAVVAVARGARAAHIRRNGLQIRGLTDIDIAVPVIEDPAELNARVWIIATKALGTAPMLTHINPAHMEIVFSIQNGMEKNALLQHRFAGHALGALADMSAELLPSGETLFTRNVDLSIGELDGSVSERVRAVCGDLDAAGVRAQASEDILGLEWSKFCSWAGMMALSVLTRAHSWKFLVDPDCARLMASVIREMGAVAAHQGVTLNDRGFLPVALICRVGEEEGIRRVIEAGEQLKVKAPLHRVSALQDLERGGRIEVEETLGHALRLAEASGVEAPMLAMFCHLVRGIDNLQRIDN